MAEYVKYKDKSLDIEERVEDLLSRMTIKEKIGQLIGILPQMVTDDNGEVDLSSLREKYSDGVGRISQFTRTSILDVTKIPKIYNRIQKYFVEETRLGIPFMAQAECLNGFVHMAGVPFPTPINMGSTFNPELAREEGTIIGDQAYSAGTNIGLFPVVDLAREPRYGRVHECFSEDPYLTAVMGVEEVKGFNRHQKMKANAKHFLAYSQTLGSISCASSGVNARTIRDEHAIPWEAMFNVAGLDSVMTTYTAIDNIPVSVNKWALQDLLRDQLGFKGTAICDGGAIERTYEKQDIGNSYEEVGALAIKAGLCANTSLPMCYTELDKAIEHGLCTEDDVDKQVRYVLRQKFQLGLFDDPYIDENMCKDYFNVGQYEDKCLEVARESLILLKNEDNFLPLDKNTESIAVIGPHADNFRLLFAGYTGPTTLEMTIEMAKTGGPGAMMGIFDKPAAPDVNKDQSNMPGKGNASEDPFKIMGARRVHELLTAAEEASKDISDPEKFYKSFYRDGRTIYEAVKKHAAGKVVTVKGSNVRTPDDSFQEAVEAAKNAKVVILAVGGKCGGMRDSLSGETRERANTDLPQCQKDLVKAVLEVNENAVIVMMSGRPMSFTEECQKAKSFLQIWAPGAQGGNAVADVLFGDVNPSGKLPVTIPYAVGQAPIFYGGHYGSGYSNAGSNAMGVDYVDLPATPQYPFGFGLSYTDFDITDLEIENREVNVDDEAVVSCHVKNIGNREGKEVVQLYFNVAGRRVTRPSKQLVAFKKVNLKPGEEVKVTFRVPMDILGYVNENNEFGIDAGKVRVYCGNNSFKPQLFSEFRITGQKPLTYERKYFSTAEVESI